MTDTRNNIKPAVLGVGNALVDIIITIPDDQLLSQFGLPRGSMTLVDSLLSNQIYSTTKQWHKSVTTGGSAANTIHALSSLGASCGYAGKITNDELGSAFENEFHEKGIMTHLHLTDTGTGRCMVMVSTDAERTQATYLGAAAELQPEDFTLGMMQSYGYLYVEGYLVQNHRLIETILKTGKEAGLKVAVDLSSFNIVAQNRDFLQYLVENYVDIVFANEEEALAYTGKSPEESAIIIGNQCEIAIVKTGKNGSLIRSGQTSVTIQPVPTKAIDTTGAGDCYASGFLYGLTEGLTLQQCGDIASLVSSKVVETLGAKIPDTEWPAILEKVRLISQGKA